MKLRWAVREEGVYGFITESSSNAVALVRTVGARYELIVRVNMEDTIDRLLAVDHVVVGEFATEKEAQDTAHAIYRLQANVITS